MGVVTSDDDNNRRMARRFIQAVTTSSKPRYSLSEIVTLVQRYVIEVSEPNSMVDWRMSDFLLWFARQEQSRDTDTGK